jgi:hypothetical protein
MNASEAARHRRRFQMLMSMLDLADIYWLPNIRRIAARCPNARIKIPLPPDARYVGRYACPLSTPEDFIGDLQDTLRRAVATAAQLDR